MSFSALPKYLRKSRQRNIPWWQRQAESMLSALNELNILTEYHANLSSRESLHGPLIDMSLSTVLSPSSSTAATGSSVPSPTNAHQHTNSRPRRHLQPPLIPSSPHLSIQPSSSSSSKSMRPLAPQTGALFLLPPIQYHHRPMFSEPSVESPETAVKSPSSLSDKLKSNEDDGSDWLISFTDDHPPPQASTKDPKLNSGGSLSIVTSTQFLTCIAALEPCPEYSSLFGNPNIVRSFLARYFLGGTDVLASLDPRASAILPYFFRIQALKGKILHSHCFV